MKRTLTFISTNTRIAALVISGLLLLPFSCSEEFLDKPLQGELTQESFPTSAPDALLAINGVYNMTRNNAFAYGLFPVMDIMSDDGRKGSNPSDAASTIGPFDNFTHIATEGNHLRWWNTLYQAVKRANVVIEKVPAIDMDATLRTRYIAEARFLRASFYFDLVRAWGGVPLVTEVNTLPGQTRATPAEVFALITDDLTTAIAGLPEKSAYEATDMGRATKGAAKALLARAYLFQNDFINAEKYAMEVINSGEYDLEADFANANSETGEHGVESVYEIGAMRFENIENGGNQYANVQGVRGVPNRGWGFNRPSMELMAEFETDDPREDATIIFLGEIIDGTLIGGDNATPDETKDGNGVTIEIECYNQKVWTPGETVPPQFGHNRRIIRYADVLLMAAEALNENGKPTEALVQLNKVRARARGGNVTILPDVVVITKNELRDAILHERRVELAMEGHRFWDLIRTGRAVAILGPLGFVAGKHELLPIPQNEIDLAQGSLEQNPGWE